MRSARALKHKSDMYLTGTPTVNSTFLHKYHRVVDTKMRSRHTKITRDCILIHYPHPLHSCMCFVVLEAAAYSSLLEGDELH